MGQTLEMDYPIKPWHWNYVAHLIFRQLRDITLVIGLYTRLWGAVMPWHTFLFQEICAQLEASLTFFKPRFIFNKCQGVQNILTINMLSIKMCTRMFTRVLLDFYIWPKFCLWIVYPPQFLRQHGFFCSPLLACCLLGPLPLCCPLKEVCPLVREVDLVILW